MDIAEILVANEDTLKKHAQTIDLPKRKKHHRLVGNYVTYSRINDIHLMRGTFRPIQSEAVYPKNPNQPLTPSQVHEYKWKTILLATKSEVETLALEMATILTDVHNQSYPSIKSKSISRFVRETDFTSHSSYRVAFTYYEKQLNSGNLYLRVENDRGMCVATLTLQDLHFIRKVPYPKLFEKYE